MGGIISAAAERHGGGGFGVAEGDGVGRHGGGERGPGGRLGDEAFAPLAGMPTPQFIASMTEFRDGRRPSTLMGHVAAVLDDMQLGVVQAREQAQPDSERHHPIVATPHQQGRHSYERRPLTSTVTKRPVYASESRGCAGSDPRRTGPSLLTDHWLVGCSRP